MRNDSLAALIPLRLYPNQAGLMRNDSPILPLNCADPTRNIPPTSYASSPAPLRTPSYDHPQKVYTSRAKCIYLSFETYIPIARNLYTFWHDNSPLRNSVGEFNERRSRGGFCYVSGVFLFSRVVLQGFTGRNLLTLTVCDTQRPAYFPPYLSKSTIR